MRERAHNKDPFSGLRRSEALSFMYLITAVTAVLYAYFFMIAIRKIVMTNQARTFLDAIGGMPGDTRARYICVVIEVVFLALNYVLRKRMSRNDGDPRIIMTLGIDLVICLAISYQLGFNYNGIILWSFAEMLSYTEFSGVKSLSILPAIVIYILTSPQLNQAQNRTIRFEDCLAYFTARNAYYIQALFNLLDVVGIAWFVVCCLNIIAIKQQSLEEIERLNSQISDANESLKKTNLQLEGLIEENSRIVQVQERNRIAREVHDSIGHTLTGLSFGLEACESICPEDNAAMREQLALLSEVCRQGIEDVRLSVASLRADLPEHRDFRQIVTEMIEQTARVTGTRIQYRIQVEGTSLDEEETDALYRVVQESITNAILHGRASNVEVRIEAKGNMMYIHVRDDGTGCDDYVEGFGMTHMRERVQMLQGDIAFRSDKGFVVDAAVPIRQKSRRTNGGN